MARKTEKIIITCAITGGVHTPTMSETLPITPDQIATQAVEAAEAGAAILHLHARNAETGHPTPDPAVYMEFLPRIKQATDGIVNITTGGGLGMSMEERLSAALKAEPELASLNMGSMNFALHPMVSKYKDWKFDWEKPFLEASEDNIFRNTFKDISYILQHLGEGCGTRFEHECYDVGHLYNLAYFVDKGLVKPPFLVQTIFGILGGIGTDPENIMFMKQTADRLFGDDYVWSVMAAGRFQMPFAMQSALLGGNVRVGMEDSLYIGRGEMAESNAQQVRKVRRMIEDMGLEIATPDEARRMLDLKGADRVKF